MSQYLQIVGGRVYDPVNGIDGETRDVFVEGDRIVSALPRGIGPDAVTRLDARGCVVMPGGIDIHTHVAGPSLDAVRQVQTEPGDLIVPTPAQAGHRYSAMGYTTIIEAAVELDELPDTPRRLCEAVNLDAGFLLELGNHKPIIDLLNRDQDAAAIELIASLLRDSGAYGIKMVNPGGVLHYRHCHEEPTSLDQAIGGTRVTPRRIMKLMSVAADQFGLPHPPHLHCYHLGLPGNVYSTLDALDVFEGSRVHLAHAQFYSYSQTDDGDYTSAADRMCEYLSRHPNVTLDVGQIVFGPAWAITGDIALEHRLREQLYGPDEPASEGPLRIEYEPKNPIHSLMWATGLELVLLYKNLQQVTLSVDHPNGGPFWAYPQIIAWLCNKPLRDRTLAAAHPVASQHSRLKDIKRELTLQEVATITRAAPAKALGLKNKGHLGTGADADIAVYEHDTADPQRMFECARHVVKAGQVVIEDSRARETLPGKLLPGPVV